MRSLKTLTVLAAGLIAGAMGQSADAAVLMYEPFNYGNSNVALNTVSGAATGLDGTTYAGSHNYISTGMTFGNLQTTGGKANIAYNAGYATRGLNFNIANGATLFGSFLYIDNGGHSSGNGTAAWLLGASNATDNNASLSVFGGVYGTGGASTGIKAGQSGGGSVTSSGVPTADGTQFLALFQVTNMNATSGSQTLSIWTLNPAQLAQFKTAGMTAANLNAAATGTGATNVLQKGSVTINGGYVIANDTLSMRILSYQYGFDIDEIRLSNASLDEVTPVPEPAAISTLLGAGALLLRRRKPRA